MTETEKRRGRGKAGGNNRAGDEYLKRMGGTGVNYLWKEDTGRTRFSLLFRWDL